MKERFQSFLTWKLPQAITNWISGSTAVKTARIFWESDLNANSLYQLLSKLNTQHLEAARELYNDYSNFINRPAVSKRDIKLKKKEKLAYELSKRTKELSKREQQLLKDLLLELEAHENYVRSTTLQLAETITKEFIDQHGIKTGDEIERLLQELNIKDKYKDSEADISEVMFLVRSKMHILAADKLQDQPNTITYLVPVFKEFNRLKKKSEIFTGEDFLKVKCEQLEFLYKDCKKLSWKVYFVDDESPSISERSIDVIKKILATDHIFSSYQDNFQCLGYEDFTKQIQCYSDKNLSKLSPEEFANQSIKGGAMQCALLYLAGIDEPGKKSESEANELILMTDADLSTNLGITGLAVWEMLNNSNLAMTIGSRRLPGSVVVGKSDERHLMSFGFNFLAHALLNVQVSDTQVGCKIIRTKAIEKIYSQFHDLTMSFDVELIRALQDNHLTIKSIPTYWRDSAFESKSADQGQNMFAGLLSIFKRVYSLEATKPTFSIISTDQQGIEDLAAALRNEPEFDDLMSLASNKKFHLLVAFSSEIYATLTPRSWRNFINHASLFLCELAEGKIEQETMDLLFDDIARLYTEVRSTPAVEFLMSEFPEIFSIAALLYKNRNYSQIIAPMLFGDRIVGRIFSKKSYRDLITYCQEENVSFDKDKAILLEQWIQDGIRKNPLPQTEKESVVLNRQRQEKGINRLKSLNNQLSHPIFVTIVMQYDMDKTNLVYAKNVIQEKMRLLVEAFNSNGLDKIETELLIVDARLERTSGIEQEIDKILRDNTFAGVVTGKQIAMDTNIFGKGKANAVRFGMTYAKNNGADIVGYIDFSNKIPFLDITNLMADVIEGIIEEKPSAAIGSRRQIASEVVNKPLTFLLRSTGLNLAVKSLFQELFTISDTQTGFKLFSSSAWEQIADHLTCQSLAFDVEILILLAKMGISIREEPVTFNDNNLDNTELAGAATEMLPDLLRIRAQSQKFDKVKPTMEMPARIAAGAEHTVYDLGDGSLLKIPTQFADPDFMMLLRNLIFNKEKGLAHEDRETGLFITQFNQLLTSKHLSTYVPLLRDISDVNVFVMRMISTLESKTKSFNLSKVLKYGKDIVGPFEFCEPFSITLNSETRTFDRRHQVKRAKKAEKIFKDVFYKTLMDHYHENMNAADKLACYGAIYQKIDEAVDLFKRMWLRGMFDLDTNILSDIGYFKTDNGLTLMSLDPGEITDDLSIINVNTAKSLLSKRSDVLLMKTQLSVFPELDADRIIGYYIANMEDFLEMIRDDINLPANLRQFGREILSNPAQDFSITCYFEKSLPQPEKEPSLLTEEEISDFISSGYQLPFTAEPLDELPTISAPEDVHLLVNQTSQYAMPLGVTINEVERGGILPLCDYVKNQQLLTQSTKQNIKIVLDAGSGTRSSLLGIQAGSKGKIHIGAKPLLEYATSWVTEISQSLTDHDLNDYVIISSCDDLFVNDKNYINNLIKYFKLPESPGLYWTELPDSGSKHMPLTLEDTIVFMNSHFVRDKINKLFAGIPFTEGYVNAEIVEKSLDSIKILYDQFQIWQRNYSKENASDVSSDNTNITIPGIHEAATRYMKLLQWYGITQTESAGIKRPFLMVMKKEFLLDFIKMVANIIPEYTKTYITWENLLLRGIKADRTVWNMFGKPPHVSKQKWNKIYDAIQDLKLKHHIDCNATPQNALREQAPIWQSLDDPYAVMTTVERIYKNNTSHILENEQCMLMSDQEINPEQLQIYAANAVKITAISCDLKGILAPEHPSGEVNTYKVIEHVLLSGITLAPNEKLMPIPGHVVVEVNGEIYSTSLLPTTKDNLKAQPVYHYNKQSGKPDDQVFCKKLSDFAAMHARVQTASVRFTY